MSNEASMYFEDILMELPEDTEELQESKLTHHDLQWLYIKVKYTEKNLAKMREESEEWEQMMLTSLGTIVSDERWKRFEIGRTYLTRWDCNIMPRRAWQAA
jgi:hypothetical protein